MTTGWTFIVGVLIGSFIGMLVMAFLSMAKQADERAINANPALLDELHDCRGYDSQGMEK